MHAWVTWTLDERDSKRLRFQERRVLGKRFGPIRVKWVYGG